MSILHKNLKQRIPFLVQKNKLFILRSMYYHPVMEIADTKRSIAKGALYFLTGTFMSRITGMARDLSMAFCFGASPAVSTFLIAFRLSNLLRRLFGEGALMNGFVPFFEEKRKVDPHCGAIFFRDLFWSIALLLTAIIVLIEAVVCPLYYLGTFSPQVSETLLLTMIQLPGLFFICLFGVVIALLQCERIFFIPGVVPVAFNTLWIVSLWGLKKWDPLFAMRGLSVVIVAAFALQFLFTLIPLKKIIFSKMNFKQWCSPTLFSRELALMVVPVIFGVIGVAATQINSALDLLMARWVSLSGPSFLNYAQRVYQLPIGVFAIAISSALLPPLSRAIKNGNIDQYRLLIAYGIEKSYTLLVPGTIAIGVLGLCSINLLFGRGEFNQSAVCETTLSLWGYAMGLVPSAFILLMAPAFCARGDYKTPMIGSLISVIVNVVINAILIAFFNLGPSSIAFSTTITAYINVIFLSKKLKIEKVLGINFIKIVVSALCGGVITAYIGNTLFNDPTLALLMGEKDIFLTRDFTAQLIHFGSLASIFGMLTLLFAHFFKATSFLELFKKG